MTTPQSWYVKTKSGFSGPFTSVQLKSFADAGKLPPTAMVSKSSDGPWAAAESVRGLFPESSNAQDLRPSDLVPDSVKSTAKAMSSAVAGAVSGISKSLAATVVAPRSSDPEPPTNVSPLTRLCTDGQDPSLVAKIHDKVRGICTSGEEVLYMAIQSKPIANFSPDCIVLTNKRFIIYRQKMLGRMTFFDCLWKDCKNVHLKENVIGAEISFESVSGSDENIDYLPKQQARSVYRIAQESEEKAMQTRRDMKLEELRAEADKTVINHVAAAAPVPTAAPADDVVTKMAKLKSLLESGLISKDEFDSKKQQILDSI